jgi:hypothetical protein
LNILVISILTTFLETLSIWLLHSQSLQLHDFVSSFHCRASNSGVYSSCSIVYTKKELPFCLQSGYVGFLFFQADISKSYMLRSISGTILYPQIGVCFMALSTFRVPQRDSSLFPCDIAWQDQVLVLYPTWPTIPYPIKLLIIPDYAWEWTPVMLPFFHCLHVTVLFCSVQTTIEVRIASFIMVMQLACIRLIFYLGKITRNTTPRVS